MIDEGEQRRRSRKPIFIFAAWFSLLDPLLAAGWVYYAAFLAPLDPDPLKHGKVLDSIAVLVVLALAFAVSFVAGGVSLWGIKANGVLVILPTAVLGILLSAALEVLVLFFLVISGLPGP